MSDWLAFTEWEPVTNCAFYVALFVWTLIVFQFLQSQQTRLSARFFRRAGMTLVAALAAVQCYADVKAGRFDNWTGKSQTMIDRGFYESPRSVSFNPYLSDRRVPVLPYLFLGAFGTFFVAFGGFRDHDDPYDKYRRSGGAAGQTGHCGYKFID